MMKQIFQTLLLFILIFSLSSCTAATPTPDAPAAVPTTAAIESTPALGVQEGYPAASGSGGPTDAYPGPVSPTQDLMGAFPQAVNVPEPKEGLGVVTGRLIELSTNQPYLAPTLILGTLVFASDPNAAPPLVGYSEETDPKATQDLSGKFIFTDIKPGSYGIVVWTPGSHTLVNDSQGNTVQVTVEAGKVVDLGNVYVP